MEEIYFLPKKLKKKALPTKGLDSKMSNASMRHAVVTGGAGFLGSHLCDTLIRKDYRVTCVDNFITGNPENISHLKSEKYFSLLEHDITKHIEIPGSVEAI